MPSSHDSTFFVQAGSSSRDRWPSNLPNARETSRVILLRRLAPPLLWFAATETSDPKNPKKGETKMDRYIKVFSLQIFALSLAVSMLAACSGGPMTTREKGAGIGALGGAAAGGLICATGGPPGGGAGIWGAP